MQRCDNLVDLAKCCKMSICLQRLVPIQPKTSEMLPKICQKLATTLRVHYPTGPARGAARDESSETRRTSGTSAPGAESRRAGESAQAALLGREDASGRQTLEGSFSAVSKPNLANKYAFESSRRDLHNALLSTALQSQILSILSKFCQKFQKYCKFDFGKF